MNKVASCSAMLVLLSLWFWSPVYPQVPIRLGVDGGINLANQTLSDNPYSNNSSRLGLIIGGLAEIGIADRWYIQAEPRYIQKGMKVPDAFVITGPGGPEPIGTADLVFTLDYLEIPILLKAKFGTGGFKPFAFVGPSIGVLLSAQYEGVGYDVQTQGTVVTLDVKDSFESVDFSLALGAGAEHQLSENISLIGNVRYSLGLNNVNNGRSLSGNTIKSSDIQIILGALFTL